MADSKPQQQLANVYCQICKKLKRPCEIVDRGRCSECNPLRMRIARLKTDLTPAESEHFESLSLDDRAAFYINNKDKFSDDLKAQISNVVTQSEQSSLNVNFVGNGEFLDEMDLKDKY